jgi:hypothetical protein
MSILNGKAIEASFAGGLVTVRMGDGREVQFAAAENPRLALGTPEQLKRIEISPFGLHWPELDEDLSFEGLLRGDYGQPRKKPELR